MNDLELLQIVILIIFLIWLVVHHLESISKIECLWEEES